MNFDSERTFISNNALNANEIIGSGSLKLTTLRAIHKDDYSAYDVVLNYVKGAGNGKAVYGATTGLARAAVATVAFPAMATTLPIAIASCNAHRRCTYNKSDG